jgi:hypothetical protein
VFAKLSEAWIAYCKAPGYMFSFPPAFAVASRSLGTLLFYGTFCESSLFFGGSATFCPVEERNTFV